MLLSGRMESALLPEPLLSLVEAQGARVLIDDRGLDLPLAVIALKKPQSGDEDAFRDRVRRFRAALAEEAERINASPETYKAMMKKFRLLAPQAEERYAMLRFEAPLTPLGLPSKEELRRYAGWMEQGRMLKKGLPPLADIVFQEEQ